MDAILVDRLPTRNRLRRLRRPGQRLVVRLPQLPSRQLARLGALAPPLALGELAAECPRALRPIAADSPAGAFALAALGLLARARERALMESADDVIVPCEADAEALALALPHPPRARLWVAGPDTVPVRGPRLRPPLRFIHVARPARAADRLVLDELRALWRDLAPPCPLEVYESPPPGEVYDGRTILLQPVAVPGALRPEVLDAFAHGAPVIGTPFTFEGLDLVDYPLCFTDPAPLAALLEAPGQSLDRLLEAARQGWESLCAFDRIGMES